MTDEEYIYMCSMKDKYTKQPTLWQLTQLFPECRYMVGASILFLEKERL